MAKKRKSGSAITLMEKLNQPVSWRAIVDVMTHDISGGGKDKAQKDFADLDSEVEKLLDEAFEMAEEQGVTLEQVLIDMGMISQLPANEDISQRKQLLEELGWQSLSQENMSLIDIVSPFIPSQESPVPPLRKKAVDEAQSIRQFQSAINHLTMDEITLLLEKLPSERAPIHEKLVISGTIHPQYLEQLLAQEGAGPLWKRLLEVQVEAEKLLDVMETERWFPLIDREKGDFAEYLLEENVLSYRQFKQYIQDRTEADTAAVEAIRELLPDKETLEIHLTKFFGLRSYSPTEFPRFNEVIVEEALPLFNLFDLVPLHFSDPGYIIGCIRPPTSLILTLAETLLGPCEYRFLLKGEYDLLRQDIQPQLQRSRNKIAKRQQEIELLELRERLTNASAVHVVEELLGKALEMRANDIHMEYQEAGFRVRFRVDGILQEMMSIHPELADEVISRIKILANMDITERRQPQDGHIKVVINEQDINMRVATVPTYHGERINIRLINSGKIQLSLPELGLNEKDLKRLERLVSRPHGMVLTTGPVGSGKTTTLYSNLARLDAVTNNVMTIEDPVEYELEGINQIESNYRLGFGFVEGLRAILRQDPNVILLGEIRDNETAAIAVRASMTGLLVFSSLHTNDAVGAITTFHNFNIPPLLIANSLLGVVAQRLLRRLCPHCMDTYKPSDEELSLFKAHDIELDEDHRLGRAMGCENCHFTGYNGRIGIFETLEITPEIREMILDKASESSIRDKAIANGMTLLIEDGLDKVSQQITTMEELKRVVFI